MQAKVDAVERVAGLLGDIGGAVVIGAVSLDPWFRAVGLPGLLTAQEERESDGSAQS